MEINLLVSTYFLHNYETTTKFYFLFKTLTVVISKYIYICVTSKKCFLVEFIVTPFTTLKNFEHFKSTTCSNIYILTFKRALLSKIRIANGNVHSKSSRPKKENGEIRCLYNVNRLNFLPTMDCKIPPVSRRENWLIGACSGEEARLKWYFSLRLWSGRRGIEANGHHKGVPKISMKRGILLVISSTRRHQPRAISRSRVINCARTHVRVAKRIPRVPTRATRGGDKGRESGGKNFETRVLTVAERFG